MCVMMCLPAFLPGCGTTVQPLSFRGINRTVNSRLQEQRPEYASVPRWDAYRTNRYVAAAQLREQIGSSRQEQRRSEDAAALTAGGPLDLPACLSFSLEHNDTIQMVRADMRKVAGESIVVQSRFLPHLSYVLALDTTTAQGTAETNSIHQYLKLSQTLMEFGKENSDSVTLRESERQALFDYEDQVRTILSDVRQTFYTITLRQEQLEKRSRLLDEFMARYDNMRKLEDARIVLEVDVLTARLNVLNEEARINSLERIIFREKTDLIHLMGLPADINGIAIAGKPGPLNMTLVKCVDEAVGRSPTIVRYRASLLEKERQMAEVWWEYGADMQVRTGWQDERSAAGLELNSNSGKYDLSMFGEAHDTAFDGNMQMDSLLGEEESGWFADLAIELPLFRGFEATGAYRKQRADVDRARYELRDALTSLESDVRKSYQSVLEKRKEVDILRETVDISRKRLNVQERLKELGKITDNELETFRTRFFSDQDNYFSGQISLVAAEESLRYYMRYFEPFISEANDP